MLSENRMQGAGCLLCLCSYSLWTLPSFHENSQAIFVRLWTQVCLICHFLKGDSSQQKAAESIHVEQHSRKLQTESMSHTITILCLFVPCDLSSVHSKITQVYRVSF